MQCSAVYTKNMLTREIECAIAFNNGMGKLQWYVHVPCSSGLAKPILQGTVKGGRIQGRQKKRGEDNIREWTGLEFAMSQRAVENREK